MILIERLLEKSEVVKTDLPSGIIARVRYPIMRFGVRNANKRMYERAVGDFVLKDTNVNEKLKTRTLFGNQEHPVESMVKLSKDDTSHIISNIYIGSDYNKKLGENKLEENVLYGDFDILPTEAGKFINILLEAGCQVGVSTRADGELEECIDEASGDKYFKVIPERYVFQTVDFTGDPSTSNARPVEIIKAVESHYESKDINKNVAIALLEMINTDESKLLENKIKEDKQHSGCKCKLGEKKCGKGCSENLELKSGDLVTVNEKNGIISHVFPMTKKAVVQFDTEKRTVNIDECVKLMKSNSKIIIENYKIDELKSRLNAVSGEYDSKQPADIENLVASGNKSEQHNEEQMNKEKALQEDVAPLKIDINKKVEEFLSDHWTEFFDENDAVQQVIKKFAIKDTDAIKYVKAMEGNKGKIDVVYAMSEGKTKMITDKQWDKLSKSKKYVSKKGTCYLINKDGKREKVNVLEESKINEGILYVNPQVIKRGNKFEVSWVIRKSDKSLACFDREFTNEVEAYTFLKSLQRDRIQETINEDEDTTEEMNRSRYVKNFQWENGDNGFDVYVRFTRDSKGNIEDREIIDIKVYDENGQTALTSELKKYVEGYIDNLDMESIVESIKSILKIEKCKIGLNENVKIVDSKNRNQDDLYKVTESGKSIYFVSENKANEYINYVNGGKYINIYKYNGKVLVNESKEAIDIEFIDRTENKIDETIEVILKNKLSPQKFESFKIVSLHKELIERKFIKNRINEEFDINNLKIRIYSMLQNERKAIGVWWYNLKTHRFEYSSLKGSAHTSDLFSNDVRLGADSIRGRVFEVDGKNVLVIYPYGENKILSEFVVSDIKYQCEQVGQLVIDYVYDLGKEELIESAVATTPKVGELKESVKTLEKEIVRLTAEKNRIAENYGNDMIRATERIEEVSKKLGESQKSFLSYRDSLLVAGKQIESGNNALKESKVINEKTNKLVEELKLKQSELVESFKLEKQKLEENFNKDLIQQYAELKTGLMGLKISSNLKTLFENCKTKIEVDNLIKQTQNALREGILHYNTPNEIVIEHKVKKDPVAEKLNATTEIALKAMGM